MITRQCSTLVSSELTEHGFQVIAAETLNEAWARVSEADIVMIDYYMPEMDGARALEALRGRVKLLGKVVLFYLYTADKQVALTFRSLGFDGAFAEKGTRGVLPAQIAAATQMLQLRRFRESKTKT